MVRLRTISLALALPFALPFGFGACSTGAGSGPRSSSLRSARGRAFPTTVIGEGRMTTRGAAGSRGVVVGLRSGEALAEFDAAMAEEGLVALADGLGGLPEFEPEREALVFVEFPDRSGTELRSVVDGFERDDAVARVIAHLEWDPNGAMTDDLGRTWVLVRVPAQALSGDPSLTLELDLEPR
jgi:hypothetical protein